MSFSNLVSAEYFSGNKLKTYLDAYEAKNADFNAGVYAGYVIGVQDSLGDILFCTPQDVVTQGQIAAIIGKFLRANPELWNKPADILVAQALNQAFPCKKDK